MFMQRMTSLPLLAMLGCVVASGSASAVPIWTINSGTVTGATGLDVGGTLYDVDFIDGTCAAVYGLCQTTSFPFADAASASNALRSFIISSGYGATPYAFAGCGSSFCRIQTAQQIAVSQTTGNTAVEVRWVNLANGTVEAVSGTFIPLTPLDGTDTTANASAVWARWRLSSGPVPVPEPGTLSLLLLGLGSIAMPVTRRRRKI